MPLRSLLHARRREVAPLWRRGAAGTVDVALFVAYKVVALRVVGGEQAAPSETMPTLTALSEASQRGETVTPRAQREALRDLVETLGAPLPWKAWTLDMLVWGLIRPGTMAWTGGQSPGKVIFGVRVVGSGGTAVTTGQALVREWAEPALLMLSRRSLPRLTRFPAQLLWSVLSDAWQVLDPDRRSLGDLLAGTRVVTAD